MVWGMTTAHRKSPTELVAEALELIPAGPLEAAAYLEARNVTGRHRDGRGGALAVYLAARLELPVEVVWVRRHTVELVERAGIPAGFQWRGVLTVALPPHVAELAELIHRGGFEELEGEPCAGTVGPLSTVSRSANRRR